MSWSSVGGTQGIGAATALRFASLGASVTVIGRSETRGKDVVAKMKDVTPADSVQQRNNHRLPEHAFQRLDVTNLRDVTRFAAEVAETFGAKEGEHAGKGLHALILCAGGLNYGPRRETDEGVEKTFAMNVLSRFILTHRLVPALCEGGSHGRVINVLGAGNGGNVDLNDLELKRGFNFMKAASYHATINDLLTKELSSRYPNVTFHHLFPGITSTNGVSNNNFPSVISIPAQIVLPILAKMGLFVKTPQDVAELIVRMATAPEFEKSGLWGPNGAPVKCGMVEKDGDREKLWRYMVERARVGGD
ncbi:hypothetical protein HK104_000379 [Borealophlyctis nickersoniae]|nr:hypothetical protein HK104_000379 [Borealophlyctis nickersoniae]